MKTSSTKTEHDFAKKKSLVEPSLRLADQSETFSNWRPSTFPSTSLSYRHEAESYVFRMRWDRLPGPMTLGCKLRGYDRTLRNPNEVH